MTKRETVQIIGNYIVEKGDKILMIRDLKGNLLKAEVVKAYEEDEKFKELCIKLTKAIKDRIAAGKKV